MKELNANEQSAVSGGLAWVAVGAAINVVSYLASDKPKTLKGVAMSAATGFVGGGTMKIAQTTWKAGQKVISATWVARSAGAGVLGSQDI